MQSEFVFALCQRGAEAALKREVTRRMPSLQAAYQRPGIVTFKSALSLSADFELPSVFARASGLSLGVARDAPSLVASLAGLPTETLCLQVVERDLYRPDEEPPAYLRGALADEIEAQLRSAIASWPAAALPAPGQLVLTVMVAAGDPWLLGLHRHHVGRCPYPGGRFPIPVPEQAPSRAYAKLEEAILAFGLPMRRGDAALELGAAPGGAAYALSRRGVSVLAVDPAEMDAGVLSATPPDALVKHLQMPMAALTRDLLPRRIEWLLMDVHLAPQVALRTARKLAAWYRDSLLGAVLTLKLNNWAFADDVDSFLAQAREMGLARPRIRQLASNRQELCLAGLSARGEAR